MSHMIRNLYRTISGPSSVDETFFCTYCLVHKFNVQIFQKSYLSVNAKLKKESVKLHQKFIESCYERLEQVFSPKDQKRDDAQEGCEIEVGIVDLNIRNIRRQ